MYGCAFFGSVPESADAEAIVEFGQSSGPGRFAGKDERLSAGKSTDVSFLGSFAGFSS